MFGAFMPRNARPNNLKEVMCIAHEYVQFLAPRKASIFFFLPEREYVDLYIVYKGKNAFCRFSMSIQKKKDFFSFGVISLSWQEVAAMLSKPEAQAANFIEQLNKSMLNCLLCCICCE